MRMSSERCGELKMGVSVYLCCFRDLRNGTIITEDEPQGDYVPFRRSLKSEDTVDLGIYVDYGS